MVYRRDMSMLVEIRQVITNSFAMDCFTVSQRLFYLKHFCRNGDSRTVTSRSLGAVFVLQNLNHFSGDPAITSWARYFQITDTTLNNSAAGRQTLTRIEEAVGEVRSSVNRDQLSFQCKEPFNRHF